MVLNQWLLLMAFLLLEEIELKSSRMSSARSMANLANWSMNTTPWKRMVQLRAISSLSSVTMPTPWRQSRTPTITSWTSSILSSSTFSPTLRSFCRSAITGNQVSLNPTRTREIWGHGCWKRMDVTNMPWSTRVVRRSQCTPMLSLTPCPFNQEPTGLTPMSSGHHWELIWQHSTPEVLHCGVEPISTRSPDFPTKMLGRDVRAISFKDSDWSVGINLVLSLVDFQSIQRDYSKK